ncbi:MAG: hypothetical protein KKA19_00245, partial [Candidatus Margulisbacteria bacterium]|nr:hypothetical protein [Candidatus Margulisiibacteriota bacterium]
VKTLFTPKYVLCKTMTGDDVVDVSFYNTVVPIMRKKGMIKGNDIFYKLGKSLLEREKLRNA